MGRRLLLYPAPLLLAVLIAAAWKPEPEAPAELPHIPRQIPVPASDTATTVSRTEREPVRLLQARRQLPAAPYVTARAAALVDATSGTVLFSKSGRTRLPIASTTKIMTALVAIDRLRPNDLVRIPWSVSRVTPYRDGLRPGDRVEAWKLLYGLLLFSGNDDAVALAVGAAGSRARFLELMNRKARRLGLSDTHFTSPSGVIDEGNYSTALDLAALARYAMWRPRFRHVVGTRAIDVAWPAPTYRKRYVTHNPLLGVFPGADGVKTGWTTAAGKCLVASARRGGLRLIAVVLGSSDTAGDAARLLDAGFAARG